MLETLYLDTARLGRMSPQACRASIDLTRFAHEHGCSLYFSQLLQEGAAAWPQSLQNAFPGLVTWRGLDGLALNLRRVVQANAEQEVIFAARSAVLMRLAGRLLFGPCRNVLTTDLTWPAYGRILSQEREQAASRCSFLPLRKLLFSDRATTTDVVDRVVSFYSERGCDGLFLPLVDNLGIRLPVEAIVDGIRQRGDLRFTVVDGAQAIGHIPVELTRGYSDLLLAGCHKWLGGFLPMGLAFFSNPGSADYIRDSLARWTKSGEIDDPLLSFSQQLQSGKWKPFGETVQLMPLFTANAAALDADCVCPSGRQSSTQVRSTVCALAAKAGWTPRLPADEFQTRILLLRRNPHLPSLSSRTQLRARLLEHGVAATAVTRSLLRVSLPSCSLTPEAERTLGSALAAS